MVSMTEIIRLLEEWLPIPENHDELEQWTLAADEIVYAFDLSDSQQAYMDTIIDMYEEQFKAMMQQRQGPVVSKEQLDELLSRKQTEQRTEAWYKQMSTIISASELGNLFSSPYARSKFVVAKTLPYQQRQQHLAVPSSHMSAFDWGIRFEPVVKQIYEYKYGTTIKELGRLYHQTDKRCAASPDGLVYHCPKNERTGRLIEIKCPVTRIITGSIPKDYYCQMQLQLHVTGLKQCDYVEAVFSSKYNAIEEREGPALYNGFIAVVRYKEIKDQELYYIYSPVNCESWTPDTDDEIVEMIPWKLVQWGEQIVMRSEEWWESIVPIIDTFWGDVEKAKRGEFVVPESTRKRKDCQIVFNKLDENGILI